MREERLWLEDILVACQKVGRYVGGMTQDAFERDERTFDAVMRNLEIIGEAVKALPLEFREAHPDVEWRRIAGLRDIVAHQYFGIDMDIVWDVVQNKVPDLRATTAALLDSTPGAS